MVGEHWLIVSKFHQYWNCLNYSRPRIHKNINAGKWNTGQKARVFFPPLLSYKTRTPLVMRPPTTAPSALSDTTERVSHSSTFLGGRAFGPPLCGGTPPATPPPKPAPQPSATAVVSRLRHERAQTVSHVPGWKKLYSVPIPGSKGVKVFSTVLSGSKGVKVFFVVLRGPSWKKRGVKVFFVVLRGPSWKKGVSRCSSWSFAALRGKKGVSRCSSWSFAALRGKKGVLSLPPRPFIEERGLPPDRQRVTNIGRKSDPATR